MQTQFYISHDDQQSGPFELSQIESMVKGGKFTPTDYIYLDAQKDWVTIAAYGPLMEKLKNWHPEKKPVTLKAEPAAAVQSSANEAHEPSDEWYILKGENKFGPFSYFDLIRSLQEKSIFEYDYVWRPGFDSWYRIAELDLFSPAAIKKLKDSKMPELSEIFFRRRHSRVKYGASILVHDNAKVLKGQSVEISVGGAGIIVQDTLLQVAQTLFLHFKPGDGVPPFNAVCEIVSKSAVKDASAPNAFKYGVKFKRINAQTQKTLHEFAAAKSTKAA
jgi:hypothetical protein